MSRSRQSRSNFFSEAFELIALDVGIMQSVIQCLASEGGLKRILFLVKEEINSTAAQSQGAVVMRSILPFLQTISYQKVLSSALLEQAVGTIYNAIFGPGGQYALARFRFAAKNLDPLSADELEPVLGVFAKTLDMNGTALLMDDFKQIADIFAAALKEKSGLPDTDGPTAVGALKWLNRAKGRLGMDVPMAVEQMHRKKSTVLVHFEFAIDLPGHLSEHGPRHDNDFADIRDIRILPTYQEIICTRAPFLPLLDSSTHHLPGIEGLIDRHFRLYREDVVGPIRETLKAELYKQSRPSEKLRYVEHGVRVNCYKSLSFVRLRCDPFHGLTVTVTVTQPKEVQRMSDSSRAEWWTSKKRLQKDSLVCILDPTTQQAIFGCVVEIKIRKRRHFRDEDDSQDYKSNESESEEEEEDHEAFFQDLAGNPQFARLTVRPLEDGHAITLADYSTGSRVSHNLLFVEFPKALQSMISQLEIPFARLLAPSNDSENVQRNFKFNLSCLLQNGQVLSFSPREEFELETLTDACTLDAKQAEALINALSHELAICQGPPGTGKSFTALALIRALVANKISGDLGPILDMEHFLDSGIRKIIRIGSRSKIVAREMNETRPEVEEKRKCFRRMANEANDVNHEIRGLGVGSESQRIKEYLFQEYPEYYQQFWGASEDGFQIRSSRSRSILETCLNGKLGGITNEPRLIRSAEELLDDECGIRDMYPEERRALYEFWKEGSQASQHRDFISALESYQNSREMYDAANQEVDLRCLYEADIIGVTTSGLARHFDLLKRLPIKILLVEEAKMGKNTPSICLSLSGSSAPRNGFQPGNYPSAPWRSSRMHPSISTLIRETLYPRLKDAPNVSLYPEVVGMRKRLFWFDHEVPEVGAETDELVASSKSNDFEVEMTACLVAHLLFTGGYEVVLDDRDAEALEKADLGSDTAKLPAMKTSLLKSLKAATIDNFQGNEGKVVIVSLVRSNRQNMCGFLKTPNRINTSAAVPMWSQVIDMLKMQGNIGPALPLCCSRHPETTIEVKEPDDFVIHAPEGGCSLRCGKRLEPCGHACEQKCHSDLRHKNVICLEPCNRPKKGCEHVCPKPCGEKCDPLCKEFLRNVNVRLNCDTVNDLLCHQYQNQGKIKCTVLTEKTIDNCKHTVKVQCHVDVNAKTYICTAECGTRLKCGHICTRPCNSCNGLTHKICLKICGRPYSNCDHTCAGRCHPGTPCGLCKMPCQVACSHSRCDKVCSEPCNYPVRKSRMCLWFSMPCGAPCDFIPCSKRCDKILSCGHQCPSVCGETCPAPKYCQQCGNSTIKDMVVDYLEMKTYKEVDLDDDPVIFPNCGHGITMLNMDGSLEISKVYEIDPDGKIKGIQCTEPFQGELKQLPGCPVCRGTLRGINRYGRLVRRVLLDESTKRFITWAGSQFSPVSEKLFEAQDKLSKAPHIPSDAVLPPRLDISGSRGNQFQTLVNLTEGWTRYDDMKNARNAIASYYAKVNKDATPFAKIWQLVEIARRRAGSPTAVQLQSPVSQVTFHIIVLALLIRCDVALLADMVNELSKVKQGPLRTKITLDLSQSRVDCEVLITEAIQAKDYERAVEGNILFARYCAIEVPFRSTPADAQSLKDMGKMHVDSAFTWCKQHGGKLQSLVSEIEDVKRILNGGTFMQTVTSEERRAVLAAMTRELGRGTAHWYTCANGHPFAVGGCGMPMEQTRCPQCGANVGGRDHRPAAGVSRADDLESELAQLRLDR
ncbi:uncharacterized protein EI97DRAFT_475520 [Westerdykella ornata]|uniref:RZ-type domain-containing protein n=1 Tax=Westerdykella ornata TaxID=318751 RepID=A0A6A6JGF1_WESOR|nr:uncharacterized protein EI97DRAFT_475520 [Westerdykella ornata]KAF2275492.1 hypothetical protein EI97DRAFT_475520 [Westerdykella ornata]